MSVDDFFQRVGFPGTNVFKGMLAANSYADSNVNLRMKKNQEKEWEKDAPIREMSRELKVDNLSTALPLTKNSNSSMRALGDLQQAVLSSPDGYIGFLNSQNKDRSKGAWTLGPDGKTAIMIDPAGGIVARQDLPVDAAGKYSGYSAMNDILRNYGTNLLDKRTQLPALDMSNDKLALMQEKLGLQEQLLQMRMYGGMGGGGRGGLGLGLGGGLGGGFGGLGGGGGSKKSGSKSGGDSDILGTGFKATDPIAAWKLSLSRAALNLGIPMKGDDTSSLSPEDIGRLNSEASEIFNATLKGTLTGVDPYHAGEGALQQRRKQAQEALAIQEMDKARGGIAGPQPFVPYVRPQAPNTPWGVPQMSKAYQDWRGTFSHADPRIDIEALMRDY